MTLRDACDVAHVLIVEQVTAMWQTEYQACVMARVWGSKVEVPMLDERLDALDRRLNAPPPTAMDPWTRSLRAAVGLPDRVA